MTLASAAPADVRQFHDSGEAVGEVLKYLAIMSFGAFVGWHGIVSIRPAELAFAASALFVARPAAILAVLTGSALPWRQRAAAAWFGPKGFSSVVYAVIVLQSPLRNAAALFHGCAVVVLLSMVMHSSTDVPVVHWLDAHGRTGDASDAPPA
jgi:sodium/hydrogen antiporter